MHKVWWIVMSLFVVASAAEHCVAQKRKSKLVPSASTIENVSPIGRWAEFSAGQKRRVHLWYEEGVWRFRCTCGINATVFDGSATVDKGTIQIVGGDGDFEQRGKAGKLLNPKNADYVQFGPAGMAFRFQCVGKLNGLDFTAPKEAKTIRFEFVVNGESKAEYIFIGAVGANPSKSSFLLPAHPE
jgi:hypothetical protein